MSKRGISPVIATVLLISLVIVIGLSVFLWFSGFVQESTTKFGKNVQILCEEVDFEVELLSSIISVANNGNVPIYDINLKITTSELSSETKTIRSINNSWQEFGLKQGESFSGDISSAISNVKEIKASPVLLGESSKTDEYKTYDCGDLYAKTIKE